jgi:hypothetical protein
MAIRRRGPRGGLVTTRLPVPTINSVGRNAANKRAPYEAENLDNCFVSLERNIEKRPGFEVVPQYTIPDKTNWDFNDYDTRVDLYRLAGVGLEENAPETTEGKDFWYYWHNINEDNRFLVAIDFKARTNDSVLFYIFQVLPNGTWKDVTPYGQDTVDSTVPAETRAYLTFGSDAVDLGAAKTAAESLQAVSVGTNIVILNKNVYAGFSCDEDGLLFNLKGEKTTAVDLVGCPITYYSAAEVIKIYTSGNDNVAFTSDDIVLGYRPMSAVKNDVAKEVTTYSSSPLVVDVVLGDKAVSQTGAYNGFRLTITSGSGVGGAGIVSEYFGSTKTARTSWTGPVPQISGTISAAPYQVDAVTYETIPVTYTAYNIYLGPNASSKTGEYKNRNFEVFVSGSYVVRGKVDAYDGATKIAQVIDWNNATGPTIGNSFRLAKGIREVGGESYFSIIQQTPIPISQTTRKPYVLNPATYAVPLADSSKQNKNATLVSDTNNVKRLVFTVANHGFTAGQPIQIDFLTGGFTIDGRYIIESVTSANTFTVITATNANPIASGTATVTAVVDDYYNDYKFNVLYVSPNPGYGKVVKYTASTNTAVVTNWFGTEPLNGNSYNVVITDCTYELALINQDGVESVTISNAGTGSTNATYNNIQLEYVSGATAITYPRANITVVGGLVTDVQIVSTQRGTGFTNSNIGSTILKAATTAGLSVDFRCTVAGIHLIEETKFIPVEDYNYFQKSLAYLGQKLNDASEIQLPPVVDDWYDNNGNFKQNVPVDISASVMLKSLYDPKHPYGNYTSEDGKIVNANLVQGRGKIYFCSNPFLNLTSGYYRVISWAENAGSQWCEIPNGNNPPKILESKPANTTNWVEIKPAGRPYLQKVRTPDKWSYIDPRRMPQKLGFESGSWAVGPIRWTPRQSGNNESNPGPSVFRTVDRTALKQTQIIGMCVFKDRLWFAADDVAFSSQIGEYENFFIEDPANIVATDPIDIRASSNAFAQITHMVPFEDYIFINTKANTQFQLTAGSRNENDIVLTPFNVMLSPATYYSAASFVDPQTIGSQLYFFDRRKLYLFTGKNNLGLNSAVEVSATANDYLPENYGFACVGHAQNTIFVTDADNQNHIYLYTIRFSGDRVIQNSFYRYVLDNEAMVRSMQVYDKHLYAVIHKNNRVVVERTLLKDERPSIPRMDHMFKIRISTSTANGNQPNTTYVPGLHETTYKLPAANFSLNDTMRVVIATPAVQNGEDIAGVAFPPLVSFSNEPDYISVTVLGRFDTEGAYVYIGVPYKMVVELSPLFIRDQENNIVDGTLNLRTIVVRHFNTGNYDIEVTHRGRSPLVSSFTAIRPDFTINEDSLPLEAWAVNGEFVGKVFGYSESTNIKLTSEYITPVNISAIEFKGKFKQKYSTIN